MSTADAGKSLFGAGLFVFDGAMGTEIYRRNVFTNRSFDELCLSEPALIRAIHTEYRDAGADVLTTNSFGANRFSLAKFGLAEDLKRINLAAAKLAREVASAADRPVLVAGSVGPVLADRLREGEVLATIQEQADALMEGGADLVFFETQPTRAALENCALAMRARPDVPFVLSFTIFGDGESAAGESIDRLMAALPESAAQPIAWGMNCGTGPAGLLTAVERAVGLTQLPLIVQPNAGLPKEVGGRRIYLCSPEYLTSYAQRYVGLGAAGVGGCCGTTPDHIRAVVQAVKPLTRARVSRVPAVAVESVPLKEPAPFAEKSRLAWRLANGKWTTTVEIVPPRGYDLAQTLAKVKILHRRGVDAINIPDGPRASSRLSPLITAFHIQREARLDAILHFCCRDRNLIGMQADLLACAACEIHNILFVTGDPPKLGNFPFASGVFDTDSIGMVEVQRRLNRGVDLGGQAIDPQTRAVIGVGADPTALDLENEIARFRRKAEVGAEFAITQPVFDPEALLRFLDRVQDLGLPILAGIWPLASYRNASFLQNEIPGVVVPEPIMERMASVAGREDQRRMGIDIAREAVAVVRDRVAGIQVSAPFGNVETALAVIEE
jgi:methionine synthase / methylenetetrahydrofolate reductase(NADPH)